MNSLDRRWRDERDLKELLELADNVTGVLVAVTQSNIADSFRSQFEALIARRAAEDAKTQVVK